MCWLNVVVTDQLEALVDPQDQAHAAGITDAAEREIVVASLIRHRVAERLAPGDPVPHVVVTHLDRGTAVHLDELVTGRAAVLVFGSYT
jgi:hypothetical protein